MPGSAELLPIGAAELEQSVLNRSARIVAMGHEMQAANLFGPGAPLWFGLAWLATAVAVALVSVLRRRR